MYTVETTGEVLLWAYFYFLLSKIHQNNKLNRQPTALDKSRLKDWGTKLNVF
jgi:hypothetical protein